MSTTVRRPAGVALRRDIVLIGAHGGAGVSTLRELLGEGCWDLGALPAGGQPPRLALGDRALVVVARGTVMGATRATTAVTAITRAGQSIAALVVVADGFGREPRDARVRFRLLESRCADRLVRVPYVHGMRRVVDPLEVDLPRRARVALADIAVVAEPVARRTSQIW